MLTRIVAPPTPPVASRNPRILDRPPTPALVPARPTIIRADSRDSEIMRAIYEANYPNGERDEGMPHTWVDTFMEKGWPKIKAKWSALVARLRARGPAA